ncbi:hypothetical protein QH639_25220 [Lysinibacillus sp. 1 U-2021]|uniref:hypothetical protein n=1 Tax=Lysinibacillus TaxID=400634 RepID=UPI002162997A|nr:MULTISPECIES: hypothetical protein [Lysinibacillus]MCS1390633.1 hypothetical protein [Lysinibacillus boronitolerans]WGT39041.1 hypothetical protein QH639_25220 [Lysinibacillus sp. 1 U-2021]
MTQTTPKIKTNQNVNFINDLIEMTKKDDKELKRFIDHNLFPKESLLSIDSINSNIDSLRLMNENQQILVKSRAKQFEESNDPTKYFPTLLGIFGLVITLYGILNQVLNNDIGTLIYATVIGILGIFVANIFRKSIVVRPTAVFFNSLVTNIQYNNEEEKTS